MRESTTDLPAGDAGIAKTVRQMNIFAAGSEGARHPEIRRFAIDLTANVPSRDYAGEIAAVYSWVKSNIKFQGEYREMLQTPLVTLQLGAGDCDDHSMLIAALLMDLGYHCRFRTVAADRSAPGEFSHVFCEVQDKKTGQWISLDTTVASAYPGWMPANITRERAWPSLNGLGDDAAPAPPSIKQTLVNDLTASLNTLLPALQQRVLYGKQNPPLINSIFGTSTGAPTPDLISGIPNSYLLWGGLGLGAVALFAGARR